MPVPLEPAPASSGSAVVLDALPEVVASLVAAPVVGPSTEVLPPSVIPYRGLDLVLQSMSEQASNRAKRHDVIVRGTHRGLPRR